MSEERRMYYMTEAQHQRYLMLLFAGREKQATNFREECDAYWVAHPEEWEKARLPDDVPEPL